MRLFLLTALAMTAFAANSVLNRMAVGGGFIDPLHFAEVRLMAGAVMLAALVAARRGAIWPGGKGRIAGVTGLLAYFLGFSLAYVGLPAGVGALILFGVVQITMFGGAVLGGDAVPARRWMGAAIAFCGLLLLLAPAGAAVSALHAGLMAVAGVGWGIYSLAGRGQRDALAATAANFVLALPTMVLAVWVLPDGTVAMQPQGVWLAVLSGAVTSGLGYALWYRVVPDLGAARAALAQLTVPVLAAAGGLAVIGEGVSWRFAIAAVVVLGGVAFGNR